MIDNAESLKPRRLYSSGLALAGLVLLIKTATLAYASSDVGWKQKLGSKLPLGEIFSEESGQPYRLARSFTDKPVILAFTYYQCPNLCTLVLNGLIEALQGISEKPGVDYRLVTLSIDPRESSRLALMKKRTYLARLGSHFAFESSSWRFLTGKSAEIGHLTEAAGFRFAFDAASDQFLHPSGFVVLSPDGVIRQYFMGIRFEPRLLSEALRGAARFRSGNIIDEILLFCFHFDPSSNKGSARAILALRVLGALCALGLLAALTRFFYLEGRT